MKAIVFDRYGSADVLSLADVPEPRFGDHELLVRVRAASVNPLDWHFMTGLPYVGRVQFGLRRPRACRLGVDLAGKVEAIGEKVAGFAPGDEVFGAVGGETHGQPLPALGSCAEYVSVPEDRVVAKPGHLAFEQVAAVPAAGLTALQGLRDLGGIEPGQRVLVNGASGGVGTFAIQIAKWFGAEVTGVCSTRNVDLVRSIGADHVVDYTREDFTRGDRRYDLLLDNVGNRSLSECRRVLNPRAVYVASFGRPENRWLGPAAQLAKMAVMRHFVSQRMVTWISRPNRADLLVLREMLATGKVAPIVDRTYPLAETADAMRHLETGRARGKIVIVVGS